MGKWSPPAKTLLKGMKRCLKTDCSQGLHCFLNPRTRKTPEGTCLNCEVAPIDWTQLHKRQVADIEHTILMLKYEHIRHEFWCTVDLSTKAVSSARRIGRQRLQAAARSRLRSSVGKPSDDWDGRQTPFEDKANALQYAQHATATCCRKCIEVWHGIKRNEPLTDEQLSYFANLLCRYVITRIPDLADLPVSIPRQPPILRGRTHLAKAS